jgi:hypothetical protein
VAFGVGLADGVALGDDVGLAAGLGDEVALGEGVECVGATGLEPGEPVHAADPAAIVAATSKNEA